MSQGEALKFLERNKKWYSTDEVAKKIRNGRNSTSSNLKKLYEQGVAIRKKVKTPWITYYYKINGQF